MLIAEVCCKEKFKYKGKKFQYYYTFLIMNGVMENNMQMAAVTTRILVGILMHTKASSFTNLNNQNYSIVKDSSADF